MKYLILQVAILLFSIQCMAQAYIPIPDSGVVYSYVANWPAGFKDRHFVRYLLMLNGEDTSINGTTYKKIIVRSYDQHIPYSKPLNYAGVANKPDRYYGGLRQDGKKVYLKPYLSPVYLAQATDTAERLEYDFDLQTGGITPQGHTITSIDSVQIGSSWHKRLNTNYNSNGLLSYIEGVGCYTGLTYNPDGYTMFACYTNAGNYYQGPYKQECFYIWPLGSTSINNNIAIKENIRIYPNPFTEQLTIEDVNAKQAFIYNSTGQLVMSHSMSGISESITTSNLNAGIYFVVLKGETGNIIHTQKLIKQ